MLPNCEIPFHKGGIMKLFFSPIFKFAFVAMIACAFVALLVLSFHAAPVYSAEKPKPHDPMELSAVPIPFETLSAATPSNVWYTVQSSDGPFCLEGFVLTAGNSTPLSLPTGTVMVELNQIDTWGLSHPYITLFNGSTGGFSPLDLMLSYGNHVCATQSITFQATEFQGAGPGTAINLWGQAMVLTDPRNHVTVTGSATQPQ
jgi:hypothetical protein